MRVTDASDIYNLHPHTLSDRLNKLGIKKPRNHSYTDIEISQVIYAKHSKIHRKRPILMFDKQSLEIVEYFLTNKNNGSPQIALAFNTSIQTVKKVLDYYLKHKELIIESKINH
jgi:hypothetical protein